MVWMVVTFVAFLPVLWGVSDTECPEPWPTPTTARGRESCSCQRSERFGMMIRCSYLTYWPASAPSDTSEIILDGNPMPSTLESYALSLLAPQLRVFSCKNCGITRIKQFAFFGLNNIDTINLEGNSINTIESYSFSGLAGLQLLNLASCNIKRLQSQAFFGLRSVERFVLSSNSLEQIEVNAFKNVSMIAQMNLNRMSSPEIQGYTLKGLRDIDLLSLAHSQITKLDAYAFYGVDNITTINFHSTALRTVSPYAFVGIGKVKTIKLKSTDISTLRCAALEGLDCVGTIHWDNNPIRCDCHLQWMVEMSANISRDLTRSFTCASPYRLSGRSVFDLGPNELNCNDEERFMGCAAKDTRVPRVQPLERYIEDMYPSFSESIASSVSYINLTSLLTFVLTFRVIL